MPPDMQPPPPPPPSKDPWWLTIENQLSAAILLVVALIAFDLFNINPIHHSGRMLRLSVEQVRVWSSDYGDDND